MFAFSTMFYVQLGPVMVGFNDNLSSFFTLGRALFGDFNIDEIISKSRGFGNATFFLIYLFVAVFVMLSMFFAILGESQTNLRDDQAAEIKKLKPGEKPPHEYGILHSASQATQQAMARLPQVGERLKAHLEAEEEREAKELQSRGRTQPTSVDRIELRQLEMQDAMAQLVQLMAERHEEMREMVRAAVEQSGSAGSPKGKAKGGDAASYRADRAKGGQGGFEAMTC